MILSVKELADKYKLNDIGKCNCGGYPTQKYSDGTYTLSWRINRYMFKLKRKNDTIKNWTPVNKMQEYLETVFK